MCRFMKKHRQYSMTIADYILCLKKLDFDDYLLCMEQDAPLDEIAIVIIACMFRFHICILTETKFWTTNREHKIGMCSLILGLTGGLEFVPLHRCTTHSGHSSFEQENQLDNVNNNASNQYNTSADSSLSLTDKLSGVFDVNELSVLIKEHAEQMIRPSPPVSKDRTPVPSPLPAEKKFIFIQHGIKRRNKQVQKLNCVLCTDFFFTQKELNAHIHISHSSFKFKCRYCEKQYQSANGCAKHEKSLAGYHFECEFCHKSFQFPKGLKDHRKIHTGKLKYQCTNCTNSYTTNRAMLHHALKHQGKLYECTKYPKKCDSSYNLSQHICGYHGDGWQLPCGEREQWPSLVQKHKKQYKTCKHILLSKTRNHLRKMATIWHKKDL